MNEADRKLALLIDAENVSSKYIKNILDELAIYGVPTYKRIYGNFTDTTLKGWKDVLLIYSIVPIQQFSYTTGKNASDSALIIDAMDILYSSNVDGFCLVSSDSDFTRLASRLREAGMFVIGMGEKKTPMAFINACEKFVFLEIFDVDKSTSIKSSFSKKAKTEKRSSTSNKTQPTANQNTKKNVKEIKEKEKPREKVVSDKSKAEQPTEQAAQSTVAPIEEGNEHVSKNIASAIDAMYPIIEEEKGVDTTTEAYDFLIEQLLTAISDACDDDGWANLADVGNLISKRVPAFDSRNYGYKKLADMLADIDDIEIRKEKSTVNHNTYIVYVRTKENLNSHKTDA